MCKKLHISRKEKKQKKCKRSKILKKFIRTIIHLGRTPKNDVIVIIDE